MNEEMLTALIERLTADLAEAFDTPVRTKLTLYLAASELLCESMQPEDREALRMATATLALRCLGVGDLAVERAKVQLATGRDQPTFNRRQ